MKISIFGLGYVGCIGMGCLAEMGHELIGVDVNKQKIDLVNSGKPTVVEKDIDELIKKGVEKGRIKATSDAKNAVLNSDVSFVCVGTPNDSKGYLDMTFVLKVADKIAEALKEKKDFHVIVIRSTVMPGTVNKIAQIIEEKSGKKKNKDFALVSNPEFLREGSAVHDFFNPPYIIIASKSEKAISLMKKLYKEVNSEIIVTDVSVGEVIKLVNNSFHALKVSFANEVGRICKKLGIDSHKLMDVFCKDTSLNISPYYLKPGFAYGGSCLPKDLQAFSSISLDKRAETPLINFINESNKKHMDFVKELITGKGKKKIGFLGVSFKPGTDDLRFSPGLELVEYFIGKGYNVNVYDSNINLSKLIGKNKEYLVEKLPHVSEVLVDSINKLINSSDIIVIVNKEKEFIEYLEKSKNEFKGKNIIDLTRINEDALSRDGYEGVCW